MSYFMEELEDDWLKESCLAHANDFWLLKVTKTQLIPGRSNEWIFEADQILQVHFQEHIGHITSRMQEKRIEA